MLETGINSRYCGIFERMGLEHLYQSQKTVFNMNDLALLWNLNQMTKVQDRARYYAKKQKLFHIKRGIYALNQNYDPYELASKLVSPSYISLETVLKSEGLVFQEYQTIFSVAYKGNEFEVDGRSYLFKQFKKTILANHQGLINKDRYWIADKERAFLDAVYLYKDYHFDNLLSIDWDYVYQLAPLYQNKSMLLRLKDYQRNYA